MWGTTAGKEQGLDSRGLSEQKVESGAGRAALLSRAGEAEGEADLAALLRGLVARLDEDLNCLALIADPLHQAVFGRAFYKRLGATPVFKVLVQENEDLLSPNYRTLKVIRQVRKEGCRAYFLLFANGVQLSRLLRFGDSHRELDTRAQFVLLYDRRLLGADLHFLWKKIVNVVFVRRFGGPWGVGSAAGRKSTWFELSTVPFPAPIQDILETRRLDIWRRGAFRQNADLFRDKTSDLQNQTLSVATFQHVPASYRAAEYGPRGSGGSGGSGPSAEQPDEFSGLEVQVMLALARAMNFQPRLYEAPHAQREQWGRRQVDGSMSGLLGEATSGRAELVLGDLHYTPYHLGLLDLSVPYHVECLTFLTPESTSDNSWQTLILPFKPGVWLAVGLALLSGGLVFYLLARSHAHLEDMKLNHPDVPHQAEAAPRAPVTPSALHLFAESSGSAMLYTLGMLLGVSLPRIPRGWALRVMTGWWWLYSILVVVAYRAALTAILANPAPRITIDSLEQLGDSALVVGGWGEHQKEFFETSLDEAGQKVGQKFEVTGDWRVAVERVAQGSFAYYENAHFLQFAKARRRQNISAKERDTAGTSGTAVMSINGSGMGEAAATSSGTANLTTTDSRSVASNESEPSAHAVQMTGGHLHIMRDCVINMPISLGLQRNSALKPRVDRFLRRVIEAGLVHKWLADAMLATSASSTGPGTEEEPVKALMELSKLYGALVALGAGYALSALALLGELAVHHGLVARRAGFDIYAPHRGLKLTRWHPPDHRAS